MLVETHSWKDYPTRVRITRNDTVLSVLRPGRRARRASGCASRTRPTRARRSSPARRCRWSTRPSDKVRTIDFHGYAYTRTPSDVSGALMTRYDETKPQIWQLPLRDDVQPTHVVDRAARRLPRAGRARGVGRRAAARCTASRSARSAGRMPRARARRSAPTRRRSPASRSKATSA